MSPNRTYGKDNKPLVRFKQMQRGSTNAESFMETSEQMKV